MVHSTWNRNKRERKGQTTSHFYQFEKGRYDYPGLVDDFYALTVRWHEHVRQRDMALYAHRQAIRQYGGTAPEAMTRQYQKLEMRAQAAQSVQSELDAALVTAVGNYDGCVPGALVNALEMLRRTHEMWSERIDMARERQDEHSQQRWEERLRQLNFAIRDVEELSELWGYPAWRREARKRRYYSSGRLIHPYIGKRKRRIAKRKLDPSFDGSFLS